MLSGGTHRSSGPERLRRFSRLLATLIPMTNPTTAVTARANHKEELTWTQKMSIDARSRFWATNTITRITSRMGSHRSFTNATTAVLWRPPPYTGLVIS